MFKKFKNLRNLINAPKRLNKAGMLVISAFLILGISYALMRPGISMTDPVCGLEEHEHTEACYEDGQACEKIVHKHREECFQTEAEDAGLQQTAELTPLTYDDTSEIAAQSANDTFTQFIDQDGIKFKVWNEETKIFEELAEGEKLVVDKTYNVQLAMDFTIQEGGLKNLGSDGTLTCTISDKIVISEDMVDKAIIDTTTNKKCGTYSITKNGELTIQFDPEYVTGNENRKITGSLFYEGSFTTSNTTITDKNESITIGDKDISVIIGGHKDALKIDKIFKEYNPETGKLSWTVEVWSLYDLDQSLVITDELIANQDHMNFSDLTENITIAGADGINYNPTSNKGEVIDGSKCYYLETDENDKFELTLPPLKASGEKYSITYTVDVDNYDSEEAEAGIACDNKATATSGEQVPVSDTCLYTVKKDTAMLWGNKEITETYNPTDGTVSYKITVKNNGNKAFDSPVVITDRLYNSGGKTMQYDLQGFTVTDETGKTYVPGEDSSENRYHLQITDDDGDGCENFTLTLPPLKAGDESPKEYTIIYSVKVVGPAENVPEEITYSNDMTAKSDDQSVKDSESFTLSNKIDMKKSGELQPDGTILWTIEVNSAYKDIGGMTLEDSQSENSYGITCKRKAAWESEFQDVKDFQLPYTFPKDDTGYYIITYYTKPENLGIGENVITNKAEINKDEGEWGSSTGTVTVTNNPINKKCQGMSEVVNDESGTAIAHIVNWITTVDIPKKDIPQNTVITDSINSEKMYMTKTMFRQISVEYNGEDQADVCTVYANVYGKGEELTLNQLDDSDIIKGFKIVFHKTYHYDPAQAAQIKIFYQTYTDISQITENSAGYFNNGTTLKIPGEKDVSSDDQYIYTKSDLLKKIDPAVSKNNGEDTTHIASELDEGELTWEIRVKLQDVIKDGNCIIVDHLPEGVTFLPDSVDFYRYWTNSSDNYIKNVDEHRNNIVYDAVNNTITFALSQAFLNDAAGEDMGNPEGINIRYKVKVEDLSKSELYKNIVQIKQDNTLLAQESQTQIVKNKLVDKNIMLEVDENGKAKNEYIRYQVEINKNRLDLSKDSQWIEVEDRLTYTLGEHVNEESQYLLLDSTSVKVYKCGPDGIKTELQSSDYNFQYKEENKQYIMKLVLPDEEYLILEYKYIVNNSDGGMITLNNDITLPNYIGEDISEDNKTEEFGMYTTGAIAKLDGVAFRKVDGKNITKGLEGAQFKLFEWTKHTGSSEDGEEETTEPEYSFEPVGGSEVVFESDENGLFILKNPDSITETGTVTGETIDIKPNTAYYLKETKIPQGYQSEDYFYFYINDPKSETYCMPSEEFKNGTYINEDGKISKVNQFTKSSNYYTVPNLSQGLVVNKVWKDKAGNIVSGDDKPDVRVTLYRKGYPVESSESSEVKVTINTYNNKSDTDRKVKNTLSYTVGSGASLTFDAVEEWEDTNLQYVYMEGKEEPIKDYTDELDSDNSLKVTRKITISDIKKDTVINLYTEKDKGANVLLQNVQISSPPPEGEAIVPEELVTGTDTNGSAIINTDILNQDNNWELSWSFLPLTGKSEDGRTVKWYYYVRETEVEGYYLAADKGNGAWGYGTVTLVNREGEPQVVLPQTGSIGNTGFTMVGMAVMAASSSAMLINRKGRKRKS